MNRNNAEPFRILVLRRTRRLLIHLDALRKRDTYGRLLTFVIRCCERLDVIGTCTYVPVLAIRQHAGVCCAAQHVVTPTTSIPNFRDQKSNHKIHENIVPRKFGAIRYMYDLPVQIFGETLGGHISN